MKEIVTFNVTPTGRPFADWQALAKSYVEPLQPSSVEVAPSNSLIRFVFTYYPGEIEDLRATLKARGFSSSLWVRREYTRHELLEAGHLTLRTDHTVESRPHTLTTAQQEWIPICPYCDFQERRWSYEGLYIKQSATGHQLASVDWHPVVVTSALAEVLLQAGFTGVAFTPAVEGGKKTTWYGLQVQHRLPPLLSPPTRLHRITTAPPTMQGVTPSCALDHWLEVPYSEYFYPKDSFRAEDFNETYEVFGANLSHARTMIISNRVYRRLLEMGVKQLACEPVRLVE